MGDKIGGEIGGKISVCQKGGDKVGGEMGDKMGGEICHNILSPTASLETASEKRVRKHAENSIWN